MRHMPQKAPRRMLWERLEPKLDYKHCETAREGSRTAYEGTIQRILHNEIYDRHYNYVYMMDDIAATYTVTNDKAWFTTHHKASEPEPIQIGNNTALSALAKGTVELPNGIALQDVRYVPTFATNIIALADLKPYQPEYNWKEEEWLLRVGDPTIRIAKENRLWPIHIKTAPTAQESTLTEQIFTPAVNDSSTPAVST